MDDETQFSTDLRPLEKEVCRLSIAVEISRQYSFIRLLRHIITSTLVTCPLQQTSDRITTSIFVTYPLQLRDLCSIRCLHQSNPLPRPMPTYVCHSHDYIDRYYTTSCTVHKFYFNRRHFNYNSSENPTASDLHSTTTTVVTSITAHIHCITTM